MRSSKAVGILVGLVASNAYAFIAPKEGPAGIRVNSVVIRPETYVSEVSAFADDSSRVTLDHNTNAIRRMSGPTLLGVSVTQFTKKAFEEAALKVVLEHTEIFGVSTADVRINRDATHVDQTDQFVSFDVSRNGLNIQDAGITLQFKKGNLSSIKSETYSEAVPVASTVSQTGDIASRAFNSKGYISKGSKWRVVPTNAGYNLVKIDEFIVAGADAAWVVQVNTSNGELYDVTSREFNLRGRAVASVYPRYFGDSIQEVALPFSEISNSAARSNERGEFQTSNDLEAPKMNGFSGQYVVVKNSAGANLAATGVKANDSWNIKYNISPTEKLWDNNDMAQAMVYVNANRIISHAQKYIKPSWFNQPLKVNVNLSRHCNAFWDGATLNFFTAGSVTGSGGQTMTCSNTGGISDVVFHEWGHGLDANTGGIQDGALSEGFGDSLTYIFTDDSKVGIEFLPLVHKPVRDLSQLKKYPEDVVNEVHADGMIVGGAWWDMYNGLKAKHGIEKARDIYSRLLLKGIYIAPKMSDAYDAMLEVDDDDGDIANGTPNFCIINKAFSRHGLAKLDSRCN